jgi:hypothetical protein
MRAGSTRLLSDLFPESAWQQGFFGRTVLVYVEETPKTKFFHWAKVDRNLGEQLIIDLEKLANRWGDRNQPRRDGGVRGMGGRRL